MKLALVLSLLDEYAMILAFLCCCRLQTISFSFLHRQICSGIIHSQTGQA
jgi:hypothetical protein